MAGYDALALVGPTASGKTGLSIALAHELGAEIISCDSMQIYKYMDIGTAKATQAERAEVPHHMVDICEISQSYSAADYVKDATASAKDIISRGKLPLFCGGTGLYLDSVMRGEYPESAESDGSVRRELCEYLEKHGAEALYGLLLDTDPDAAAKIHKNNTKRVMRALEISRETGMTKTEYDGENSEYRGLKMFAVCLNFHNRETLYSRIEARVDEMIEQGLCGELEKLLSMPEFMSNQTAVQAIGYKELFPYMRAQAPLSECTDALKRATRRYAKRQLTWFSHRDYIHMLWADCEDGEIKSRDELTAEFLQMIK